MVGTPSSLYVIYTELEDTQLGDYDYLLDEKIHTPKYFVTSEEAIKFHRKLKLSSKYLIGMVNHDGFCFPVKTYE